MMPLPTSAEVPGGRAAGRVGQLDHPGRLGAALVDAEQPAAAELDQRVLVEELDLEPARGAEQRRRLAQLRRVEVAVRRVGEVAGEAADRAPATCPRSCAARRARRLLDGEQGQRLERRGAARAVAARRSGSARAARPRRWPGRRRRSRRPGCRTTQAASSRWRLAARANAAAGVAQRRGVEVVDVADADRDHGPGRPPAGAASAWPDRPSKPAAASAVAIDAEPLRDRPGRDDRDADGGGRRAGALAGRRDAHAARDGDASGTGSNVDVTRPQRWTG